MTCTWDISALHGAHVKVTVIEAVLNEGCFENRLTVLDDTPVNQNSSLKFPGLSAQCGQTSFPPSTQTLISKGVVTVKFVSLNNNFGPVKFKLLLEATAPQVCPSNLISDTCPDGPCCRGLDCCVLHVGTVPKGNIH